MVTKIIGLLFFLLLLLSSLFLLFGRRIAPFHGCRTIVVRPGTAVSMSRLLRVSSKPIRLRYVTRTEQEPDTMFDPQPSLSETLSRTRTKSRKNDDHDDIGDWQSVIVVISINTNADNGFISCAIGSRRGDDASSVTTCHRSR